MAIVLLRRQHRLFTPHPKLLEDLERRLAQSRDVEQRLGEVEKRLDFAERLLIRDREENRLSPPDG